MRALNCSCDGSTGWRLGLFGGVDGEGDDPEAVVVGLMRAARERPDQHPYECQQHQNIEYQPRLGRGND